MRLVGQRSPYRPHRRRRLRFLRSSALGIALFAFGVATGGTQMTTRSKFRADVLYGADWIDRLADTLGGWILRIEDGITDAAVAKQLGVSPATLYRYLPAARAGAMEQGP